MGSHGRGGIGKLALGSVAESALRHLPCPAFVCGPLCKRNDHGIRSIVVGTKLPFGSVRPMQYAIALAKEFKAKLTVVHTLPAGTTKGDETSAKRMEAAMAEIEKLLHPAANLHPRYSVRSGDAAQELLRAAKLKTADLMVMGVRERGVMVDHLPWTTIAQVIRTAHCPVLTVPPVS